MAKVSGPLMSNSARGALGGALIFSQAKSGATVRKLGKPSNPKSINQMQARNYLRIASRAAWWVNKETMSRGGEPTTDKQLIKELTPDGANWVDVLVSAIIGDNGLHMQASLAIQEPWGDTEYEAWAAANLALIPPIPEVTQQHQSFPKVSLLDGGMVLFDLQYGLYTLGLGPLPNEVPPEYIPL